MKKIYQMPETAVVEITSKATILAGSPDGFSNDLDETNGVDGSAALSRHSSVWGDDEE